MDQRYWLTRAADFAASWAEQFGPVQPHASHQVSDDQFGVVFEQFTKRLENNYPFFHPRYAGQMVKPPHPAAIVGYLTAMQFNPNNHAQEGGPATTEMERECVAALAEMVGFDPHVGHLTTSGTMANLEALYVARQLHPGKGIAFSSECHYTHERMCHVLGIQGHRLPVDAVGRVDLDAVEHVLHTGRVGTIVATTGTTGLGAVDQVHEIVALARNYGARVHVDAAYGGFYSILGRAALEIDPRPWRAIASCDSVAVDPHKHGLQPYGCGAVLFADPRAGKHLSHDSPYTYFTDSQLHLGEISLECSRAGASAAALWLTLQLLPLTPSGFGAILAANRRAAVTWASAISASSELSLYQQPELDIVTYFPSDTHMSTVDARSDALLRAGMAAEDDPVYLSLLRTDGSAFRRRHPQVVQDTDSARVLRSVLMKPESEAYVDTLHARVEELAARV
ncbi:aminotransferase class V-fold PLP-dependent enzyme [Kibdelosporangium philippinense]|uniref:Aminotransferase class V-fold PLP-dependent enzyme n=1 Tax=Kibdelosporangium philippinense TaxID=211113 RepID=A0ABS8Z2B6_9PSEU|nr:aminotransferase class V-fold PLP-dependent enzyme [Kibdelosporangium philippinense]MCE7001492.1 aminotransferase class V-fold PLP-dependent enzyme [Kibdelosporangium philippinense]